MKSVIALVLAFASLVAAQSSSRSLALVNGEAVTEDDLARMASGRIRQLAEAPRQSEASFEIEKQKIRWRALSYLVERKLIRLEAERQMISEDALLDREVDNVAPVPSDETVAAFLDANRVRMPLTERLSRREALSQVRAYITEQTWQIVHDSYIERLWKQYGVKTTMDPLRLPVATAGFPARGRDSAPVTIVVFSDFQCDHCAAVSARLAEILKDYRDSVRILYRQFPLAHVHKHAQKAAEASLCAHDQNRFWEYHDALFGDQKNLTVDALKQRAAGLKLDLDAFAVCLDGGGKLAAVNKELDEGYELGVTSTPTIFINGRKFYGNRDTDEIRQVVDEELNARGR